MAFQAQGALRLKCGSSRQIYQLRTFYFRRLCRGQTRGGVTLTPSELLASQEKGRHNTQGSEDSRRAWPA